MYLTFSVQLRIIRKLQDLGVIMSDWPEAGDVCNTDTGLALQEVCIRPLSCRVFLQWSQSSCVNPTKASVWNLRVRSPANLRQDLSLITLGLYCPHVVRVNSLELRAGEIYNRRVGQPDVWDVQMSRMKSVRLSLSLGSRGSTLSFSYPLDKVKVKLSLCLTEHHDMKACGTVGDSREVPASCPGFLPQYEVKFSSSCVGYSTWVSKIAYNTMLS